MGKNILKMYENGCTDDLMDEIEMGNKRAKISAKNKMPKRQDPKRTKTSYIAASKKAAKKQDVDTSEIEGLNEELCRRGKRRR